MKKMKFLAVTAFLACMLGAPVMAADVNVADQAAFDANAQNGNTLVIGGNITFDATRGGVILTDTAAVGIKGADGVTLSGPGFADDTGLNWGEKGRLLGLQANGTLTLNINGALKFTGFDIEKGGLANVDGVDMPAAFGGVFASNGSLEIKDADGLVFTGNGVSAAELTQDANDDVIPNAVGGVLAAVYDITVTGAKNVEFSSNGASSKGYKTPLTDGTYTGFAVGGAVASREGTVDFSGAENLVFKQNGVIDEGPGAEGVYSGMNAMGGAIYGQNVNLSDGAGLVFEENVALGADAKFDNSMAADSGIGGAVMAVSQLNLSNADVYFKGNMAIAGSALADENLGDNGSYTGGSGIGGALAALDNSMNDVMHESESHIDLTGATGFFINNTAMGGSTAALYGYDDEDNLIVKSVASVSGLGGAIASRGSVDLSGSELWFEGNRALADAHSGDKESMYINGGAKMLSGLGGAVFANTNLTLQNATITFKNNSAYGAHVQGVVGNATSSGSGGAIYFRVTDDTAEFKDIFKGAMLVFEGNQAVGGDAKAGGAEVDDAPSLNYGTSYSGWGGAVFIGNSKVETDAANIIFKDNLAQGGDAYGGNIVDNMLALASGRGGAMLTPGKGFTFTSAGNLLFEGNRAVGGNAYNNDEYLQPDGGYNAAVSASGLGGAIFASGKLEILGADNLVFKDNQAVAGIIYGAEDRDKEALSSGQGGAIFADAELVIAGTGILFDGNIADGNGQMVKREYFSGFGGAIYVNNNLSITNTGDNDIIFMNNVAKGGYKSDATSGHGGAIYIEADSDSSSFDLKTEGGGNIIFYNNRDGFDGANANAIYFANNAGRGGDPEYDSSVDMNVDTAAHTFVLIADGMESQGGEAFAEYNALTLTVTKSGQGTLALGAQSNLNSEAVININEGRFMLLEGARLNLNGGRMFVTGYGVAPVIKANEIDLTGGEVATHDLLFTLPSADYALLVLQGDDISTGGIATEITRVGAFDYDENLLAWAVNKNGDTVLTLKTDVAGRINFTRSGGSAMTAPLAILADNPMSRGVFSRMENTFKAAAHYAAEDAAWYGKNVNVWADATYRYTRQTENAKYKINTPGWIAGVDFMITDRLFVGGAVSVSLPEYRSHDADVDATSAGFAVYAGLVLPWRLELGAFGGYTNTDYDQKRKTVWGNEWSKFKNDYDSDTLHVGLSLSRPFSVSEYFKLRPFASYEFMRMDVKGYSEDGGDLMGMHFKGYKNNLHRLTAGLDAAYNWENGAYVAVRAYYAGILGDRKGETAAYFINDPDTNNFNVAGDALDRNSLGLGASFGVPVGGAVEFTGGYNFLLGSESKSHQGYLGISIKF